MCLADLLLVLAEEAALPEIEILHSHCPSILPMQEHKESTFENVDLCVLVEVLVEKESIS